MILRNIWFALLAIRNRDRIPKLPRAMLATKYDPGSLTRIERDIMARLGTRDKQGIKQAMKRYKVKTPEALLELLEHQKPRRRFLYRLKMAIGRLAGGYAKPPHIKEIKAVGTPRNSEIESRLKATIKAFEE